ncbi:MAG TPA: ABC transporter permease [Pirellulaceae bacterium]|nr:ABC transporter permease [Pirellulaceae bacterium]
MSLAPSNVVSDYHDKARKLGVCGVSRSSFVTSVGRSALLLGKLVLAKTQVEAMQFAFMIMLPSVLLSGFAFPRAEMSSPIFEATFLLPANYFIEILRGIVLRGAGLFDLNPWVVGLTICCCVILMQGIARFRKQLS